jgi:hypothetical protein
MIEPNTEQVIVCTKCGSGWRHKDLVPEDWTHHENIWFVPGLGAQGPWCGGKLKYVNRLFATQVADRAYQSTIGEKQ